MLVQAACRMAGAPSAGSPADAGEHEHLFRKVSADGGRRERPVVRPGLKIGRNDPCPCGSGRKYKKCCQEA